MKKILFLTSMVIAFAATTLASELPKVDALVAVRSDKSDTTKKAYLLVLSEFSSTEEALQQIKQLGFKPACPKCLESVIELNPVMARRAHSLISIDFNNLIDRNGSPAFQTFTFEKQNGMIWKERGWEINTPITSNDGFVIIVEKA